MKENGLYKVIVKGRISSVSWLERPPFNAKKVKGSQYFQYEMEIGANELRQLSDDLEDIEKVWFDESPILEREIPHPAYAGFVQAFKTNPSLQRKLDAGYCYFGPDLLDADEAQEFVEKQIEKILSHAIRIDNRQVEQEVDHILEEVRRRGGDAYAEYKARLQELAKL